MDDQRRMDVDGRRVVNFGCDSYLGLDRHARVRAALVEAAPVWGLHSGASRMFYSVALYDEAERRLADWMGVEDTLIFPSVTLANMGVLPGLVQKGELLLLDRKSHDSLHQAAAIAEAAGVSVVRETARSERLQPHLTVPNNGIVLACDGLYSMSGDSPPLAELDALMRQVGGLLYIDDAHSTGVVGARGRGSASDALGEIDEVLVVGSLSKAFSCMGAFVTCSRALKPLLKIKSQTYIFGGPVPPPYLAAIIAVCGILGTSEYDGLRAALKARIDRLRGGLKRLELTALDGAGPIVAIPVGSIEQTLQWGRLLFERGFYVQSVTFPAVSVFDGMLRVLLNANHELTAVDGLLNAFADVKRVAGRA